MSFILDTDMAKGIFKQIFLGVSFSPPTSFYVALLDSTGVELDASLANNASYLRQSVARSEWSLVSKTVDGVTGVGVENSSAITWPFLTSGEEWRVQYARVFDDQLKTIATINLGAAVVFGSTTAPQIPAGELQVLAGTFSIGCEANTAN